MGMTSIAFIVIFALCVVADTLLGMIRGRNRSLLRLGLIALSTVVSLLVYMPITKFLFDFDFNGFTITGYINELFEDAGAMPESIYSLVFSLVQILTGILIFVAVFLVIKLLTWLIAFPILKIFVGRENKKDILLGAAVGLVQGILVAVIICAPLSGIITESGKLSQIEIDGNKLVELPDDVGIEEYTDSVVAKFFDTTGGWLFDIISTTKDDSERTVSITSVCNTATTLLNMANEVTNVYSSLDSSNEMSIESIKNIGDAFINVGTAIEELDKDSKVLVNDLINDVKELAATALGELPPELETMIDNVDVENIKIKSAGEALNAMVKYVEDGYANNGTAPNLTQEDVNDIVNGIADNMFVLDMLGTDDVTLIEVDDLNVDKFNIAIENANLTQEEKEILRNIFSLN